MLSINSNVFLSKSEFQSDQTLLSKNEICPLIIYQTIASLQFMKTLIYYQTLIWSYSCLKFGLKVSCQLIHHI